MIGMSLDAGGHLTHGFRPNISGKLFSQRSYGVNPETEQLDYGNIQALANEFRPLDNCRWVFRISTKSEFRQDA